MADMSYLEELEGLQSMRPGGAFLAGLNTGPTGDRSTSRWRQSSSRPRAGFAITSRIS
jgi:hypothetical protein